MNVAFLFESRHKSLKGWAEPPVARGILGSGILQASNREMRISVGEILVHSAVAIRNLLAVMGKEADRLIEKFNAGLHAERTRAEIAALYTDLVKWIVSVIKLDPEGARKPYLAYESEILRFAKQVAGIVEDPKADGASTQTPE